MEWKHYYKWNQVTQLVESIKLVIFHPNSKYVKSLKEVSITTNKQFKT